MCLFYQSSYCLGFGLPFVGPGILEFAVLQDTFFQRILHSVSVNSFLTFGLLMWFKYSHPGSPELVFVSHVIHPCHFYIRKYSQIKDATVLEKKVNEFCSKSVYLDPSDILELGNEILL